MRIVAPLFALALFFAPALSCAQTSDADQAQESGHYMYRFDDDPLAAVQSGPWSDWFTGRTRKPRTTLIRPRVQFVPELLKSAEQL